MRLQPVVLLLLAIAFAAHGQSLPNQSFPVVAEFAASPPSAVTVDVIELPSGTQVANDLSATQISRDSATQALWRFDLSSISGFPANCEHRSYLVTFVPDAADCSETGTPTACATNVYDVGGTACAINTALQVDYFHTSLVISGQGISQSVIDYYGRRGEYPIKWRSKKIASDGDFSSPEYQVWDVYFYTVENQVPRICTVATTTDPSSSLPTQTCH